MSRTYRRKNYYLENNTSWDRGGKKLFGRYATYNFESGVYWSSYREMTKEEKKFHILTTQRDNLWYFGKSVPSWYNNIKERSFRMYNKQELHKWKTLDEYEIMCYDNPPDTSDWY